MNGLLSNITLDSRAKRFDTSFKSSSVIRFERGNGIVHYSPALLVSL